MKLKRMHLTNWMSYRNYTINFDDSVTFITGGNGSGKSLLSDAISLIYYGEDTNNLNYAGDNRRSAKGAIHWVTATKGSLRKGRTVTYIILEFEDDDHEPWHFGVRYISGDYDAKMNTTFFIGEGNLESIGADDEEKALSGTLTMNTKGSREEMFRKFFARCAYPETSFIEAKGTKTAFAKFRDINRSIFKNGKIKEKSLSEYVKNNIFPATSTTANLNSYIEHMRELDRLQEELKAAARKREFLEHVVKTGSDYITAKNHCDTFAKASANINAIFYTEAREREKKVREEEEAFVQEGFRKLHEISSVVDSLNGSKAALMNAGQTVQDARTRFNNAEYAYEKALATAEKSREYTEFIRELKSTNDFLTGDYANDQEILQQKMDEENSHRNDLLIKRHGIGDKIAEAENMIRGLRGQADTGGGVVALKKEAAMLRDRIAEAVPEASPEILCDCISSVLEPDWQSAAEGLIGINRFGVIVPPEYFDLATRIQKSVRGNKNDVAILNTKKTGRRLDRGLSGIFTYSNPYAEKYMDAMYGEYVLADTDELFEQSYKALRQNGQYKIPGKAVKPGEGRKRENVFGKAAIEELIESYEKDLADAKAMEEKVKESISTSERMIAEFRLARDRYISVHAYYDPKAEEYLCAAEKEKEDAKERYFLLSETEDEKQRQIKLADLDKKIEEVSAEMEGIRRDHYGHEEKLKTAEKNIRNYTDKITMTGAEASIETFSEEEQEWIRSTGVLTRGGSVPNTDDILRNLTREAETARNNSDMYLENREMLDRFVDCPEKIRSTRDLDYYLAELKKANEASVEQEDTRKIAEVQRASHADIMSLLQQMGTEYEEVHEMRDRYNRYISKYKIGSCYYRIGDIRINTAAANSFIMNCAKKLSEGRSPSIDELNEIERVMVDAAGKGDQARINVFDYTKYIDTKIEARTEDSKEWKDSKSVGTSTGQHGILMYILKITVLASQCFTTHSLKLIIADEILKEVDNTNKRYFFQVMKEMGIQCILLSYDNRFSGDANLIYTCRMDHGQNYKLSAWRGKAVMEEAPSRGTPEGEETEKPAEEGTAEEETAQAEDKDSIPAAMADEPEVPAMPEVAAEAITEINDDTPDTADDLTEVSVNIEMTEEKPQEEQEIVVETLEFDDEEPEEEIELQENIPAETEPPHEKMIDLGRFFQKFGKGRKTQKKNA